MGKIETQNIISDNQTIKYSDGTETTINYIPVVTPEIVPEVIAEVSEEVIEPTVSADVPTKVSE